MYEMRVAEFGDKNEYTIRWGNNMPMLNRGDDARELLTKLLVTSKQVLGPDNNTTKVLTYFR